MNLTQQGFTLNSVAAMGFKLLVLCLCLLAVAVRGSPLCECASEETENSVKKYNLKMSKDGKDYDEEIEIDTEKETETFHVPKTSNGEEAADMIYDFKKNLLMIRVPKAQSCFMINSTGDAPKPAELATLLERNINDAVQDEARQRELKLKQAGALDDRLDLSDEMADLCKKLPIYRVVEADFVDKFPEQKPAQRGKRRICEYVTVCICVERWVFCHKITRECFSICSKALCGDVRQCY